ncbi:hypothetical protein [Leptotrichia trevisanii]|uniref:hypothetical protein n=1 Tax=Leptotrichia trevisanii TaxID=109328 RepID=UPI0026EE1464|nr:hypothetical protein [Leptotrichia trevisanii]
MILKNLNYIKHSHNVRYVIFSIFFISNSYKFIRYMNIETIGSNFINYIISSAILFIVISVFFKIFNIDNNIAELELVRRINEIYIPKENYLGWSRHNDVGVFFVDPEKKVFWFCGKQTNYDLYIDSIFNTEIKEERGEGVFRLTRIIKRENEVNEFIIYPSDLVFD